jgi:hypothetical protein
VKLIVNTRHLGNDEWRPVATSRAQLAPDHSDFQRSLRLVAIGGEGTGHLTRQGRRFDPVTDP